ncbi:hypothetical protein [Corynebacterium phocae]|uniref:hypothetical protein n=1 Tax=Corynebacterium phocae TaxID=161895 RepID=UPI000953241B|nr:hypothetical protein [Corynebacterium phocae]KAA8720692.1 hypothetical protein F4V58_12105 [Corynebacterium phocae]
MKGEGPQSRSLWQKIFVAASMVAVVITPSLSGLDGWAVVALILAMSFLLGLIDGRIHRSTWSFPLLIGLAFSFATRNFFNAGAWIYVIPVVALVAVGSRLGARLGAAEGPRADVRERGGSRLGEGV